MTAMVKILKDSEINRLFQIPKPLPKGWRTRLNLRESKLGSHKKRDLPISMDTLTFTIKCRQNAQNPFDFSIILCYQDGENNEYRLLRCNGKHPSAHTNKLERQAGDADHTFDTCFHVHQATERYQEPGYKIDGYAERTDGYNDYETALEHFVKRCGFVDPDPPEPETPDMFGGVS